jgi:hypothetical protein
MHFLMIYPAPAGLGGIQTLIARMSRWLVSHGHEVSLLVEQGENWTETLPTGVRCVALGSDFRKLYYYFHAKRLWESLGISQPDIIKSFCLGSSWIACQLAEIVGDDCKVIAGMYGSLLFKWYYSLETLSPWDPARLMVANYLRCIPTKARVVCGMDQILELEEVYHQSAVLWPIPLDASWFETATRKPKWGKIASVGKLGPMKDYNFYMIDVVKELRRKGHNVTWSTFGTGSYETQIRERVQKEGLQDVISLEGELAYHRFWQALSDAYVFVGMGTAILEAAMFKVPNVNALAYDRTGVTSGPVYRIPPGSIGPALDAPPKLKVSDEIERILLLSPEDYEKEGNLNYEHVKCHEIEASMNQFLRLAQDAPVTRRNKALYLANYPRWFIHRAARILGSRPRGPAHPDTAFLPGAEAGKSATVGGTGGLKV